MPDLSSDTEYDNSIYAIIEEATGKIVYVGLTSYDRDGARFVEHVNNDVGYPWHKSLVGANDYQTEDDADWPYYPRKLYNLKGFTALETAASEQYYWEANGGLTGELLNKQQPLRVQTFLKYKNAKTFRAAAKGFPPGWAPKV